MLNAVSHNIPAVQTNHRVQQNKPVQKAAAEESKVNAEEMNESAVAERREQANKVGNTIDKFA